MPLTTAETALANRIAFLLTEIGFGGGGGGGGDRLAVVAISGQAPDTVNPDPTTRTLVPGVTLSLTLAATKTVRIAFEIDYTSTGGGSRFSIYIDGTLVWPEWGTGSNVEVGWFEDAGDGAGYLLAKGHCVRELTAGTYTIEVRESASGSTAGKTYYSRLLEVRDVT